MLTISFIWRCFANAWKNLRTALMSTAWLWLSVAKVFFLNLRFKRHWNDLFNPIQGTDTCCISIQSYTVQIYAYVLKKQPFKHCWLLNTISIFLEILSKKSRHQHR
jgi:hypothetical protein